MNRATRLTLGGAIALAAVIALWHEFVSRIRCGYCGAPIGSHAGASSQLQMTTTQAHLQVCPRAPLAARSSLADLARDPQSVDWARLRQEATRNGWVGGPHGDPTVIHASVGQCAACDAYPELQADRRIANALVSSPPPPGAA
jgi:hypothetical protein